MSKKRQGVPRHVAGVTHMAAAPGPTVQCGGRAWRFGFNDQDAKARLEELIRAHVLRDAIANKKALGGADGAEAYQHTDTLLKQGHYLTFAKGWNEVLGSPVGGVLYPLSLLQHHHPDATEADVVRLLVEEPEQTEAAVRAISPSFWAAVATQKGASAADAATFAAAIAGGWAATPAPASASTS